MFPLNNLARKGLKAAKYIASKAFIAYKAVSVTVCSSHWSCIIQIIVSTMLTHQCPTFNACLSKLWAPGWWGYFSHQTVIYLHELQISNKFPGHSTWKACWLIRCFQQQVRQEAMIYILHGMRVPLHQTYSNNEHTKWNDSIHWGWVKHISVSRLGHHWFR